MIKHIKLENFKKVSLFDTDLESINILVGTNNSGKSSVLQGIHFSILAEVERRIKGRETIAQNELLYVPASDFTVLRHGEPYTVSTGNESTLQLTNDSAEECTITLRKSRNFGNIAVHTSGNNSYRQIVNNPNELYVAYTPGLSGITSSESLVGKAVIRSAAARGDANMFLCNILYYINEANQLEQFNRLLNRVFPNINIEIYFDSEKDIIINVLVLDELGYRRPLILCGTGLLQVIQIMAYSVYFKPKLMLLDEPDEHLHPENQLLLSEAIKMMSQDLDMQFIIATHSRHLLSALEGDAKYIWMKGGVISNDDISKSLYNVLVDLGALDTYDSILQGKYCNVILTEDSDTKYLEILLKSSKVDMNTIKIISYKSCSQLESALYLANYLYSTAKGCNFIIHRDRDFYTNEELKKVEAKFDNSSIKLWVTDFSDIEAYFTRAEHISKLTGKEIDDVSSWINSLIKDKMIIRNTPKFCIFV